MKGPMFRIHPRQNGFDLSITGHFHEVHVSEDDETCLYCRCDVTRGQGVKATNDVQKMYASPDEPMMNSTTATVVHVITNYLNIKII